MRRHKWLAVVLAAAMLLGVMPAVLAGSSTMPGLVSYWPFDEGTGTIAHDVVGGNDGVLYGPTWDEVNKAPVPGNVASLKFDGVDDYVQVPHAAALSVKNVTIVAWVWVTSGTSGNMNILRKGPWADREYGIDLVGTRQLRGWVNPGTSGGASAIVATGATLTAGQWHHVGMTYDGTFVRLYLNGAPHASSSATSGDIFDNTQTVRIGGQPSASEGGLPFHGHLDEVAIYNGALTAAEVKALWDRTPPVTEAQVTGIERLDGWYVSPVTVTLAATDFGSGLDKTDYRVNAQDPADSFAEYDYLAEPPGVLFDEDGLYTVDFYSVDLVGNVEATKSVSFKIDQTPPVITAFYADPTPVGNGVVLQASATDNLSGVAKCEYSLNGTDWWPFTPGEATTITSTTPVVLDVQCRVTDNAGNVSDVTTALAAIYDPTAGFVTGGGWIWSPEGAYITEPDATGKATFGFVSRYQRGATIPTGNTQFVLHVDRGFTFRSTSYEWLVISGARAQYKGEGRLNNVDGYGFMLTAVDGSQTSSQDYDSLRIKIWCLETGAMVYDNLLGAEDTAECLTALGGGSIVIHTPPPASGRKS